MLVNAVLNKRYSASLRGLTPLFRIQNPLFLALAEENGSKESGESNHGDINMEENSSPKSLHVQSPEKEDDYVASSQDMPASKMPGGKIDVPISGFLQLSKPRSYVWSGASSCQNQKLQDVAFGQHSSTSQGQNLPDFSSRWYHPFFTNKTPSTFTKTFSHIYKSDSQNITFFNKCPKPKPYSTTKANPPQTNSLNQFSFSSTKESCTSKTQDKQDFFTSNLKSAFCMSIPDFDTEDCIAMGEEFSYKEEYENFGQVWEHTKKRLRVTIIKEKTIKIRKEESELKKRIKEKEESQLNILEPVEEDDTQMVSKFHKKSNFDEPEAVLFASLAEERSSLHAQQVIELLDVET